MTALAHSVSLKSLAAVLGGGRFSPLSLFSANEPGGWYDPSDLTTLFQDAAGTTPVTAVEQPVGLVLDKSRGLVLGSEAVVTGTAPWARGFLSVDGTISASGSAVTITQGAGDSASFRWVQPVACVVGRYYRLTIASFSRSGGTAAQLGLSANSSGTGMSATNSFTDTAGFTTIYVAATAATMYVTISLAGGSTGNSATFTGISVRELPGNHLSQSTSTARPVLSARVNLLTYTEQFDNAAWTKSNLSVSANTTVAPDGTTTADTVTSSAGYGVVYQAITGVTGTSYTASIRVKKTTGSLSYYPLFQALVGGNGTDYVAVIINTTAGTLSNVSGTGYGVPTNPTCVSLGDYWVVSVSFTATGTSLRSEFYPAASTNGTTLASVSSGSQIIWGADLRPSNAGVGLPAYQRVTTSTDYDTTGFPLYLKFDGTDDFLVSGSIDFTGTNKMSVFAGVRKLSDTFGFIAELSASNATNNGTFSVQSFNTDRKFYFGSRGTTYKEASGNSTNSPVSRVITGIADIGAPLVSIREDGVAISSVSTTQGTGNYGNYPLYVGREGGTIYPFNGHLYSLIVRGAATNAATIAATETWVNSKTRAY